MKNYLDNYNKRLFRKNEIFFVESRIVQEDRENGYFYYECRGSDKDIFMPVTIEENVLVNFAGTVISKKELIFTDSWELNGENTLIALTDEESDNLISGYTDFDDEE